jgi:hypothetical protein
MAACDPFAHRALRTEAWRPIGRDLDLAKLAALMTTIGTGTSIEAKVAEPNACTPDRSVRSVNTRNYP